MVSLRTCVVGVVHGFDHGVGSDVQNSELAAKAPADGGNVTPPILNSVRLSPIARDAHLTAGTLRNNALCIRFGVTGTVAPEILPLGQQQFDSSLSSNLGFLVSRH
jgi:hypothetical protein